VVTVLFLLVLMAGLLIVCMAAVWSGTGGPPDAAATTTRSRFGAAPHASTAASASTPESLEGVLVAQMTTGEITRRQYLRAMAELAERDAKRHPMSVPSDGDSSENTTPEAEA
jgi:hypothetical protein